MHEKCVTFDYRLSVSEEGKWMRKSLGKKGETFEAVKSIF